MSAILITLSQKISADITEPLSSVSSFPPASELENPLSKIKLSGREWFVSPDGKKEGEGRKESPFEISYVCSGAGGKIQPGDIVWLRGGRYGENGNLKLQCPLKGTKESPIIVRAYPHGRVTIDGSITDNGGAYIWFWGFEITNSSLVRKTGWDRPDFRNYGMNLFGRGTKVINMIINNVVHPGIGFWSPIGDEGKVYGTLIRGVGLYDISPGSPVASGWTRGSGIYAQNQEGNRYIRDVISFRNFTTGFKVYTEGGWANGFHLRGNVCFDNADWNIFVAANKNPIQSIEIDSNFTYRAPRDNRRNFQVGYYSTIQNQLIFKNNFSVGALPLLIKSFKNIVMDSNTLISKRSTF